jgi:hypothetical protein
MGLGLMLVQGSMDIGKVTLDATQLGIRLHKAYGISIIWRNDICCTRVTEIASCAKLLSK